MAARGVQLAVVGHDTAGDEVPLGKRAEAWPLELRLPKKAGEKNGMFALIAGFKCLSQAKHVLGNTRGSGMSTASMYPQ